MVVSRHQVVVKRPLKQVFTYLMNLENYPVWQSGLVRVAATDGMSEGSFITFTAMGLGKSFKLVAHVTENNGRDQFRAKSHRGPITFDSSYKLSEVADGTKIELKNQIETHSVFNLALPVLQAMGDSKYQADLETLKAVLESETD